ncbi:hypothetical protein ACE6H2_027233 [Prunus campanulata]
MDKVLKWRNALKEAANMSGFDNSKRTGTEADFIEKVAEDVLTKLNLASSSDLEDLDQFYSRKIEEIESLLCLDSPDVCTVGIWGKSWLTTLGYVLFHRLSCQFEATCFLANVKETEYLACGGHLKFGPGSRIIITTRDRSLLKKTLPHDKIYKFGHKDGLISWALKIGVSVRDMAADLTAQYVPQWASDQPAQPSHSAGQL